jgi:phage I-like protein
MLVSSRGGEVGTNDGGTPPGEFRLFPAGWFSTTKGDFLFDDEARASVLAQFQAHGVDLMIDLEHLSLDPESRSFDPDARGWARVEERGGELWAVAVKWTEDGAQRLRDKRQRYVSPTFEVDRETRRVLRLVNVAITGLPATHKIAPLVAAAERGTVEDLQKIAEALGCEATLEGVLAALGELNRKIAEAVAAPKPEGEAPKPDAPKPEATAETAEPKPEGDAAAAEDDEKKKGEAFAMRRQVLTLSGARTGADALRTVETWRLAYVEREKDLAKFAADRKALDDAERLELVATMVRIGAEDPAGAWADVLEKQPKQPAEPWASMPLASLRARVERLNAAPRRPAPRAATNAAAGDLSPRLAARVAASKADPAKVAATLSAITRTGES